MDTLEFILKKYNLDAGNESPIEIPGMTRVDLAGLFGELGFTLGVEVGTERGVYAETICKNNPGVMLYCVDPYLPYPDYREHTSKKKLDGFLEEAKRRLKPYDVRFIKDFSHASSAEFSDGELDFVYIDGNHGFQYIAQDLVIWSKKVRRGGIVAGHDYIRRKNPAYLCHVVEVVNAYAQAYKIAPWFVLGSKDPAPGERRDKPRSWMFIKK